MNKKFLSAILFGALMVTSTGTFVSCKDYDDDIDRIDTELSDLKSQLAALQSKFDAGKYITSVTQTESGLTFTMNDGQTYNVTNGSDGEQGEPGAAGDKVEINDEGFFIINGEVTEWKAVAKDASTGETIKIKTPTVSEDGCWVFYDEKGEAHSTTIKVAPVTAVQNADKTWTLTVYDANGGSQEIIVPTAASSLTDLMLITREDGTTTDEPISTLMIAQYDFKYDKNNYTSAPDREKWKGQKALYEEGYILAPTTSLKIQVNPTSVDAADLDLKLVDSKENYASNLDLLSFPCTDIEYFARAANANGLYYLSVADKYFKKTEADTELENYWEQFDAYRYGSNVGTKAYAVTAGGDVRSKYEVKIAKDKAKELKYLYLYNTETGKLLKFDNATDTDPFFADYYLDKNAPTEGDEETPDAKMEPNVWYQVAAHSSHALYDMHLVFSNDDKTLFGIETIEKDGVVAIRLTKTPDNITKAGFELTIQNVDRNGVYNEAKAWIGQTSTITNEVVYDAITHKLSKNNTSDKSKDKNFFQIDLTKMKEALGTEGLALWNNKVKRAEVAYYNADGSPMDESAQIAETFVSELKDNMKGNGDKAVAIDSKAAANMIFAVNNTSAAKAFEIGKQYTAVITFYDAATRGEKLNSIKVPFTFTLPAITELFEIDPGFVKDNVANCYLYNEDFKTAKVAGAATFKLSRIFSKYDYNGFTVKLNTTDKIGSTDKKTSELADLNAVAAASANATLGDEAIVTDKVLAYLTLSGNLGEEKGYDQVLKLTIDGKFDNAWTYPSDAVFNFQVKVMSPLEKGQIVPKEGNVVTIKASDLNGYKFGNDVIIGYTYNSEVSYKVMPDVADAVNKWSRNDILKVEGKSANTRYFDVTVGGKLDQVAEWGTPTNATEETVDGKEVTTDGALVLKGYQVNHTVETSIDIKVTDIWKRAKTSPVPVKITVGE